VGISERAAALQAERTEMLRHHSRVIAQNEQWLVDAEVRETRRALLRVARLHTRLPALGFLDADFLALADRSTVLRAIIDAAVGVGGAAAADLQLCDPEAGTLRIAEQRGFGAPFLAFFADVGPGTPSACATAWSTRAPVVVDQVTRSPIFAGHLTGGRVVPAARFGRCGGGGAVVPLPEAAGRPCPRRVDRPRCRLGARSAELDLTARRPRCRLALEGRLAVHTSNGCSVSPRPP
jgi:hypothetical protein